jgi:hypothetical protein
VALDLTFLEHLSDDALRREARARGVDPTSLGRHEILAALAPFVAAGAAPAALPFAPTHRPPPRGPAAASSSSPPRTLAGLLHEPGQVERAQMDAAEDARARRRLEERGRLLLGSLPEQAVLRLLEEGPWLALAYRIDRASQGRAEALLADEGHLGKGVGLASVRVTVRRGAAGVTVERRQEDLEERRGLLLWRREAGVRVVVGVGVVGDGRFVSVRHLAIGG